MLARQQKFYLFLKELLIIESVPLKSVKLGLFEKVIGA